MRYRVVHPGFWTDKTLSRLSELARLTYIGLWMLADDAGWIDWHDPEEVSVTLFPWEARNRDKKFGKAIDELAKAGRIEVLDCGHAFIPKLHIYQKPGHPWYANRDAHKVHCGPIADKGALLSPISAREEKRSERREENQSRASAHEENGGPSFKQRVEANGLDPAKIGHATK